jgi:hypothetical protein
MSGRFCHGISPFGRSVAMRCLGSIFRGHSRNMKLVMIEDVISHGLGSRPAFRAEQCLRRDWPERRGLYNNARPSSDVFREVPLHMRFYEPSESPEPGLMSCGGLGWFIPNSM